MRPVGLDIPMTFNYVPTHQSASDASPAMLVALDAVAGTITLVNEDGFVWTDPDTDWVVYGTWEPCCENYLILEGDLFSNQHTHDCENYDPTPVEQWEVTEPRDVYYTGTGEDIGDDSYIDYLNR